MPTVNESLAIATEALDILESMGVLQVEGAARATLRKDLISRDSAALEVPRRKLVAFRDSLQANVDWSNATLTTRNCVKMLRAVWIQDQGVGSFHQLRAEFLVRASAIFFEVRVSKFCNLDCALVPASVPKFRVALKTFLIDFLGVMGQSPIVEDLKLLEPVWTNILQRLSNALGGSNHVPIQTRLATVPIADLQSPMSLSQIELCDALLFAGNFSLRVVSNLRLSTGDLMTSSLARLVATGVGPIVAMFPPNAAVWDTSTFSDDWLSFYSSHGISQLLVNYRGFSRSTGWTTPAGCVRDADAAVRWALDGLGLSAAIASGATGVGLGVHGRSIGGTPACWIARQHSSVLGWCCGDRNFRGLDAVAGSLIGGWARWAVACGGFCGEDNVGNYLKADVYKIICCDPRDGIIPDSSSLKSGLALRVCTPRRASALRWPKFCDRVDEDDDRVVSFLYAYTVLTGLNEFLESPNRESFLDDLDTPAVFAFLAAVTREMPDRSLADRSKLREMLTSASGTSFCRSVDSFLAVLNDPELNSAGCILTDCLNGSTQTQRLVSLSVFVSNFQIWGALADFREFSNSFGPNQCDKEWDSFCRLNSQNMIASCSAKLTRRSSDVDRKCATMTPDAGAVVKVVRECIQACFAFVTTTLPGIRESATELVGLARPSDAAHHKRPSTSTGHLGHLVTLAGGHNGGLSEAEEELVSFHLSQSPLAVAARNFKNQQVV